MSFSVLHLCVSWILSVLDSVSYAKGAHLAHFGIYVFVVYPFVAVGVVGRVPVSPGAYLSMLSCVACVRRLH